VVLHPLVFYEGFFERKLEIISLNIIYVDHINEILTFNKKFIKVSHLFKDGLKWSISKWTHCSDDISHEPIFSLFRNEENWLIAKYLQFLNL